MYALPKVNFFDALKQCLTKYATFKGRTRRSEYWFFMLVVNFITVFFLTLFLLYLFGVAGRRRYYYNYYNYDHYYYDYYYNYNEEATLALGILLAIHIVFIALPTLAATVRRLHDINKSGWYYLMILIPIAGPFIVLVYLCTASVDEGNTYGEVTK